MADLPQSLALARQSYQARRFIEAADAYQQALRTNPRQPGVWNELGATLQALRQPEDAARAFQEAVRLAPTLAEGHANLGTALAMLRRFDQAIESFQTALRLKPGLGLAHFNLGKLFQSQAKWSNAIGCYRESIRLQPQFAEAWNNLGNVLWNANRFDEAVDSYREALRLKPQAAGAHLNLGNALIRQGKLPDAIEHYREAVRLQPGYDAAQSGLLMALNYDPNTSPDELFQTHLASGGRQPPVASSAPESSAATGGLRPPLARPLRIGYVSPDFRRHTMAAFIEPILTHHDRKQVTVFAYAEVEHPDAVTERLKSLANEWRWTIGQSDQQVAELVRADGIDILIDLAGHTSGNRLRVFALRPAPVQVTYLGYPNTTGLEAVDYRITDAETDPPEEPRRHTEDLIRLPNGFACFTPPTNTPEVSVSPASSSGFITFGSIHNLAKLNDRVLDLWCEVLKAVPNSRLLVSRHTLVGRIREELTQRFVSRGIDSDRIALRHATDSDFGFLTAFHDFDIMLDTFPWGANTTTYESLWMGVPVLTLYGDRHAGRWAATIQPRLGLTEFVAHSQDEFIACAVELAKHLDRLAELRAQLRERMHASPLCDGRGLCRELEDAYRTMWERTLQ